MSELRDTISSWAPFLFVLGGIALVSWRARVPTPFQKSFSVKQQEQLELSTRQVDQMKQSMASGDEMVRQLARIADALEKRQG